MNCEQLCRLCMSTNNRDDHLNIFSVIGIEMKMNEIISEHFKCKINELDPLPNYVCQSCWQTTESFHELYQRSKTVQQRFLINPFIKIEPDTNELWQSNEESQFVEELHLDVGPTKFEANEETSNLSDNDPMDYDDEMNSAGKSSTNNPQKSTRKRGISMTKSKQITTENRKIQFEKIFLENKHRFDLKCEDCPKIFVSLTEARKHYANDHNNPNGFIKCCNVKLINRSTVLLHLNRHLDPDKFKCHECGKVYLYATLLKKHIKRHTSGYVRVKRNSDPKFSCDICKKKLKTKTSVVKHFQWHAKLIRLAETVPNKELPTTKCDVENSKKNKKTMAEYQVEFDKLFVEHKHLFDMSCDMCSTIFASLTEARVHYAQEHNIRRGYIKCCSDKIKFPSAAITHLKMHLDREQTIQCKLKRVKNLYCKVCFRLFGSNIALAKHMKKHEGQDESSNEEFTKFISEDNFEVPNCQYCDAALNSFHGAKYHYKEYHNHMEKPDSYIKCKLCSIEFKEFSYLRDHVKLHLDPNCFRCDLCSKVYQSSISYHKHMQRHKIKMQGLLTCDYCNKRYSSKSTIIQHMFAVHVKSNPKFECEVCHKKFQLLSLLKSHKLSHQAKKCIGTCEICGKGFYTNFHLAKHQNEFHRDKSERLHESKQCAVCHEWLLTKSGVFYHQQLHTSGVHICEFEDCKQEFSNRVQYLTHKRKYHREHKFKCSYCEKTYFVASLLKKHEESHTRHQIYGCPWCDKKFTLYNSRRTHVTRDHPLELQKQREMRKLQRIPTNIQNT